MKFERGHPHYIEGFIANEAQKQQEREKALDTMLRALVWNEELLRNIREQGVPLPVLWNGGLFRAISTKISGEFSPSKALLLNDVGELQLYINNINTKGIVQARLVSVDYGVPNEGFGGGSPVSRKDLAAFPHLIDQQYRTAFVVTKALYSSSSRIKPLERGRFLGTQYKYFKQSKAMRHINAG